MATGAHIRLSIIENLPNEWSSNDDIEESSSEDHTQSSRSTYDTPFLDVIRECSNPHLDTKS